MLQKKAMCLALISTAFVGLGCGQVTYECKHGEVPGIEGACYLSDGGVIYWDGAAVPDSVIEAATAPDSGHEDAAPAAIPDAGKPPAAAEAGADASTDASTPTAPDAGKDGSLPAIPPPECTSDKQCTATAPLCRNESCEACATDGQCAPYAQTPHCGSAGACVACRNDADCGDPAAPVCGPAGMCTSACSKDDQCSRFTAAPHCGGAGACVGCRSDADCGDPNAPVCGAGSMCVKSCSTEAQCSRFPSAPHCGGAGACVACRTGNDCGDPAAPVCGPSNTCTTGCTQDAQCARPGLASWTTNVCATDRGGCVQCMPGSPAEAAQCTNGNACTVEARTCTGKPRGTVGLCGTCGSDSECGGGTTCINTTFQSQTTGGHCTPVRAAVTTTCPIGNPWQSTKATSVAGHDFDVCVPKPTTTCEAFGSVGKTCTSSSECGAPGLDDGQCRTGACTVECTSAADCRAGSCFSGYCN
jgi:hypothetical protein